MLLNYLYSLYSFQIIPYVSIIYEKHCHVTLKIYHDFFLVTIKHEKPSIALLLLLMWLHPWGLVLAMH
jgi:hypothetical protein